MMIATLKTGLQWKDSIRFFGLKETLLDWVVTRFILFNSKECYRTLVEANAEIFHFALSKRCRFRVVVFLETCRIADVINKQSLRLSSSVKKDKHFLWRKALPLESESQNFGIWN